MSPRKTLIASLSSLVVAGIATACSAGPDVAGVGKDEPVELSSQDFSTSDTRIAGSLSYGETSPLTSYRYGPRYVAYKFAGNAGDPVDVSVRSSSGDPVTWILDNDWHVLAANDDAAPGDTNSRVKLTLPSHPSVTHYIVVREYSLRPMSFTVQLGGGAVTDWVSGCNLDADCQKVDKGCCALGDFVPVLGSKASAYKASLGCPSPVICPAVLPKRDDAMAECNRTTHKCELVQPKDILCGGFVAPGYEHTCPPRYSCRATPSLPDRPGHCVEQCGGIAGFTCQDPNDECVDDPTDGCDPAAGGADCGGICQPKVTPPPPPPPPPPTDCRSSGCASGRYCTFCWSGFACIPNGAVC